MSRVGTFAAVSVPFQTDRPFDRNATSLVAGEYMGNVPLKLRPVFFSGLMDPSFTFTVTSSLPRPCASCCRANVMPLPSGVHAISDAGGPGGWLTGKLN